MDTNLLQTKLYIPTLRPSLVPRPHLIAKLDSGQPRKLILLSAPAGYGKTTLITEWIDGQENTDICWLSLDEDDNDPHQFFNYLAAAKRPLINNEPSLSQLLQSSQPPPAKSLMTAFVNDVTPVTTPFTLILDDYHAIDSLEIDTAMAFLLDHMPPQMTLVITSRTDPGFPISRLRARGELIELRADDLRFSEAEAAHFLQQSMGLSLSPDQIAALESRTEGWITGLQMAALSMQNREDVDGFVANFTGSHRFIMDYLVEEVLNQQSLEVRDFLMKTAVLDRLCAGLCDAVRHDAVRHQSPASQQILEQLELHNIFLIPLDDDRRWYRYHHLFADLLQQQLRRRDGGQINELHQRASHWYEENGLITDALYHARAADDFEHATNLIVAHTRETIAQGNSDTVFAWINAMPDGSIRTHPLLAIGKGWSLLYQQKLPQVESYLLSAEAVLIDDGSQSSQDYRGEIYAIRALSARYAGHSQQAVVLCRQALAQLPAENVFARALILTALGGALRIEGETQEAISVYVNSISICAKSGHILALMGVIYQLHELYVECGRLRDAEQLLQQSLETYHSSAGLPATGLLYMGLGALAYERNELDQAATQLQKVLSLSQSDLIKLLGQLLLAQIQLTQGNHGTAESLLKTVDNTLRQWPQNEAASYLRDYAARMALGQGDLAAARHWQQTFQVQASESLTYTHEFQSLVLARLLIAEGRLNPSASFFTDALTLLGQIEKTAVSAKRFGRVMEAQLLQALAHDAMGSYTEAVQLLQQALLLAEKEGFLRTFVNEGEPMAVLLSRLEKRPFITKLLATFPDKTRLPQSPISQPQIVATPVANSQSFLIESLSERETEILTRIAAGLKNKEIAAQLFISLNTVHYHTKNLYGKLGVNKRTQAVAKAKELNLL